MNKNLLAILAIGFVTVLFGSMVSANVIKINASDVAVKNTSTRTVLEHRDVLTPLRERLANADEDARSDFRRAYSLVRAHIAEYRKNNDSSLHGWSVQRILNQTELSNTQKQALLEAMTSFREEKNNGSYARHTIVFWNVNEEYMAYGKMGTVMTSENGLVGKGVGFNNLAKQRFAFVWGNGVFAGVQNGEVFWGTYDVHSNSATMNYGDARSVEIGYSILME